MLIVNRHPGEKIERRAVDFVALQDRVSKRSRVTFQMHPPNNYDGPRVFCGALGVGGDAVCFELPRRRLRTILDHDTALQIDTTAPCGASSPLSAAVASATVSAALSSTASAEC